ncbi:thioredoxin fold domain-containing protein [Caballeronia sp. EK]|uniref:thioredoxin fold domain-containing protein n=1 Tax=Caballeronia sp. EK TaxID=2767469 RepID=UPI001655D770|nr:thioredoxin fold domain-containing protein [Caballeronia sp. EK]MBC8641557.1 thioredoxin fold domain-containing protein [Caballeronia sp. EK]
MRKSPDKSIQDTIIVDPDGTVCTAFARTGHLGGMTKVRYGAGVQASIGSFSVTTADKSKEGENAASAPHALIFVSESAGEEKIAIVERFESLQDARSALQGVTQAVRRYVRSRRRRRVARTVGLYAAVPFVGFIVAMSAVRFMDSHQALPALVSDAQANEKSLNEMAQALSAQKIASNFIGASGVAPQLPAVSAPLPASEVPLPKIHFGQASVEKAHTLYVYADPNCPACKRFEPHLQDLAKDYSVYVLPVPFKDGSMTLADKILCSAQPSESWRKVMAQPPADVPADVLNTPECSLGYGAITMNAEMYKKLDFKVTPMVVDDTGYVFPEGATASVIRAHLASK